MRFKIVSLKNSFFYIAVLFVLLLFAGNTLAYGLTGWAHGASGYDYEIERAKSEEKPLILYFNTEWCGYCKKMKKNYLNSSDVVQFLSDIPKVDINPDKGNKERSLSKIYGVTGFPTFLVFVPSFNNNFEVVHPFKRGGNWTTKEFINAIRAKLTREYSDNGLTWPPSEDKKKTTGKQAKKESSSTIGNFINTIKSNFTPANDKVSASSLPKDKKKPAANQAARAGPKSVKPRAKPEKVKLYTIESDEKISNEKIERLFCGSWKESYLYKYADINNSKTYLPDGKYKEVGTITVNKDCKIGTLRLNRGQSVTYKLDGKWWAENGYLQHSVESSNNTEIYPIGHRYNLLIISIDKKTARFKHDGNTKYTSYRVF